MPTSSLKPFLLALLLLAFSPLASAQKRMVLVDQDALGPGGSDQMSLMVLLQSPDVQVLGITVVTGDAWRDEEVQHTLRMLELIGRTDVPVVPGAVFPLVRTQQETRLAAQLYGKVTWLGAWGGGPSNLDQQAGHEGDPSRSHDPYFVPPLPEGSPHTLPLDQDAAHFLVSQVHAHPHQVTICALGPLTNIALALAIDPHAFDAHRLLGKVSYERGDFKAAVEHYLEAISNTAKPPASLLFQLSKAYWKLGNDVEADRWLARFQHQLGREHEDVQQRFEQATEP